MTDFSSLREPMLGIQRIIRTIGAKHRKYYMRQNVLRHDLQQLSNPTPLRMTFESPAYPGDDQFVGLYFHVKNNLVVYVDIAILPGAATRCIVINAKIMHGARTLFAPPVAYNHPIPAATFTWKRWWTQIRDAAIRDHSADARFRSLQRTLFDPLLVGTMASRWRRRTAVVTALDRRGMPRNIVDEVLKRV